LDETTALETTPTVVNPLSLNSTGNVTYFSGTRTAALWVMPVVCGYRPVNIEANELPVFGHWQIARSKVTPVAAIFCRLGDVDRP